MILKEKCPIIYFSHPNHSEYVICIYIYIYQALFMLPRLSCRKAPADNYITVTSQWTQRRLKSPASRLFTQPFIQAHIRETSKLRVTGLCAGNSPVTGEFPAQRTSTAGKVSIWWRHHVQCAGYKFAWNWSYQLASIILVVNKDLRMLTILSTLKGTQTPVM